jgi:hypothetical protein
VGDQRRKGKTGEGEDQRKGRFTDSNQYRAGRLCIGLERLRVRGMPIGIGLHFQFQIPESSKQWHSESSMPILNSELQYGHPNAASKFLQSSHVQRLQNTYWCYY